LKAIISKVLGHPLLKVSPPVLVDIGASGALPEQWEILAPYSICVAFDADTRDFVVSESENGKWKKLFLLNRLVSAKSSDDVDFYLTKSPYCSSMLQPDNEALKPWAFSPLFEVDKVVKLPAVDLHSVLEKIGLTYIDWYKTDSQGADLRIFDALPKNMIKKIISAEFEPGIIDAYKGEDKLHQLMAYMDKLPFWVSHMQVKGSQRLDQDDLKSLNFLQRKYLRSFLKIAPGWSEISYINKLIDSEMTCREYLLAWVFATIKGEHGFGLHVAKTGAIKFNEALFDELHTESMRLLSSPFSYALLLTKVWKLLLGGKHGAIFRK
jgi:hypothetical protein